MLNTLRDFEWTSYKMCLDPLAFADFKLQDQVALPLQAARRILLTKANSIIGFDFLDCSF